MFFLHLFLDVSAPRPLSFFRFFLFCWFAGESAAAAVPKWVHWYRKFWLVGPVQAARWGTRRELNGSYEIELSSVITKPRLSRSLSHRLMLLDARKSFNHCEWSMSRITVNPSYALSLKFNGLENGTQIQYSIWTQFNFKYLGTNCEIFFQCFFI